MSEINFPQITLRDYQKPFWNAMAPDKDNLRAVLVWPRRCGKDITCINLLAAKAMQRRADFAYIAPYATQVRNIIWNGQSGEGKKFIDYIPQELIARKLDQTMKVFLKNGSTITLYGSDNPDALVGTAFAGVIFTEFSLHKDVIWHFIRPMLLENKGWAVFNGTPRGMNAFYQMAEMAKKNSSWFYERLTCEDTGFPTLEQIQEEREAGMPESLIEQEFYTSWTSSSEETLIPLEFLQKTTSRPELLLEEYDFAPRIIGVDPAYAEKGDRAVIARRQGRKVFPLDVYQGIDPMALAAKVAHYLREWRANYAFIDAGRGEAVWSRLFQLGFEDRVIPVNFGGKTYDTLYHRKKDEIWGRMKKFICSPQTPELPDEPDLMRDLSAPTFEINDRGQMQIESKKALKKRGFTSTDLGDALALTFSEELDETPFLTDKMRDLGVTEDLLLQLHNRSQKQAEEDYDPLTYMESLVEGKAYANF
jgi:hypothetical protein